MTDKKILIEIAEKLHELFCHSNHIDACPWEYMSFDYDLNDPRGGIKNEYLKKAIRLADVLGKQEASEVLNLLLKMRYD